MGWIYRRLSFRSHVYVSHFEFYADPRFRLKDAVQITSQPMQRSAVTAKSVLTVFMSRIQVVNLVGSPGADMYETSNATLQASRSINANSQSSLAQSAPDSRERGCCHEPIGHSNVAA